MSGKAYTMKEMKNIVDYLTEHRAYSEIKGRKMWMDLESSKITNRTWQSLKETFLKRILPDIHNPYYKLSIQQISSFQQGYDIETRLNNKLEIRSTDPESNKNGDNEFTQIPDISKGKEEDKAAGEDPIQSNLRASTETLLLENCYETAEDIRKDLQSPTEADNNREKSPTKSMRELITYSEPLTPMLQSVIDDFASDEDCDEPKMQIVEQEEPAEKKTDNCEDNVTIEISDSEGNETHEPVPKQSKLLDPNQPSSPNKIDATNNLSSKISGSKETEKPENLHSKDEIKDKNIDNVSLKTSKDDKLPNSSEINKNVSNNTTDTLLPANQEALEKKFTTLTNNLKLSLNKKNKIQNGRKRASSQDIAVKSKKRVLDKKKSTSDTEPFLSNSDNTNKMLEVSSVKQTITEESTQLPPNIVPSGNNLSKEIVAPEDLQQDDCLTNSTENENPCLNSVSLYAEQFSNTKYSDSETSHVEDNNNIDKNENKKTDKKAEISDDKTQKDDEIINREVNEKKEPKNEKKHKKIGKREERNTKHDKIEKNNDKNEKNDAAVANTRVGNEDNDMIVLNSHSDSVSDSDANIPSKKDQKRLAKQQKERALANVFGFSSGGAPRSHRRGFECRRRTISHKRKHHISSASSDWTSDTGSDYVSPPPRHYSRKTRMTRKYIKPKSARIMSLEEEGGLFVMYGKKIYPLVRDGKTVKSYLSLTPEDDDDPEESFWKSKYVQEKKKTAELTKLLNKAEEKEKSKQVELNEEPALPTTTHNSRAFAEQQDTFQRETKISAPAETKSVVEVPEIKADTEMKTVKIKFIKKNEEVQIEGHWSHLNPVLAHVAQLFQKEPEEKKTKTLVIRQSSKPNILQRSSAPPNIAPDSEAMETVELSDPSTPVEDFIERVNKREDEIAKEIEEHFKAESSHEMESNTDNITRRKGRPRSSTAIKTPDSVKKMKLDTADQEAKVLEPDPNENKVETIEHNDQITEHKVQSPETREKTPQFTGVQSTEKVTGGEKDVTATKRRTRTRKTVSTGEANDKYTLRTRRSTSRKSSDQGLDTPKVTNSKVTQEEDNIRYKFPPKPSTTRKSYTNKQSKVPKKANQRNSKSALNLEVPSCENFSSTSEENRAENQDSDFSRSSSLYIQRITSIPSHEKNAETIARQDIHPNLTDDLTSESNSSFTTFPLKSMTFQNSTLSSEIYASESYRLLMNKECSPNTKTSKLERIEEANISSDVDLNVDVCSKIASSFINCNNDKENKEEALYIGTDNDNSSSISLPTSPVLSIVENITISKDLLSSVEADNFSLDDNIGSNDDNNQIMLNELMPDLDLSMPLMEQECGLEKSCQDGKEYHYNLNIQTTKPPVSDSLVNKINTINIDDRTLSESLTIKLRDLLLKSSKKDKDISGEKRDEKTAGIRNIKSKKRSSTPRKRSNIRNLKLTNVKPTIEDEHMESCSQISKKSCPPIILITDCGATEKEQNYSNDTNLLNDRVKRGRKKKDIIKVKINRPKRQMRDVSCSKENSHESKTTDSGINDTVTDLILKNLNDSVDLIHNHSETCLSAHECMGDSVQIIEKSAISMISLNSNSAQSDITFDHKNALNTFTNLTELFNSDAQDGASQIKEPKQVDNNTPTVYLTPQETLNSPNSLISEDLSDEIPDMPHRNTKWYLLSEEESNTNFLNSNYKNSDDIGYGSRLEQIFPITCAIPDLSTITEISRENGDSKKCDDTDIINKFNSPSIFDN